MPSDDRKMFRPTKSQRAPYVPLGRAVERAKEFYKTAERHEASLQAAALAWKYSEKSSGAGQTVAALLGFGLLEDRGLGDARRLKLTDSALRIIRDPRENSPERGELLQKAALLPESHRETWDHFGGPPPSEDLALLYLKLDRGFSDSGAEDFIHEYMSTLEFAGLLKSAVESEQRPPATPERAPAPAPQPQHREISPEIRPVGEERIVFTQEVAPSHYLRVLVSGPVDEEVLDALETYLELQRKRLTKRQRESASEAAN